MRQPRCLPDKQSAMSQDDNITLPAGFGLRVFDSVGSTNDIARDLAADPSLGNQVVWGKEQTGGRGRSGRRWTSPKGNLYASVLIQDVGPLVQAANLSMAAAIAMGEAVASLLPDAGDIGYKWPNDLLLDRAKFCGLLLECGAARDNLNWVVIGSGVNIASHPVDTPYPATDLMSAGFSGSVADLLQAYIARLDIWVTRWRRDGFHPIREMWLSRAVGLGEMIRARLADGQELTGRFQDLDKDGGLLLDIPGKGLKTITAGDVFLS